MSPPIMSELSRIERKREMLEQLLSYARQLARLQGGVESLQQMLKPSQIPGKKTSAIADFCKQLDRHDTPELKDKLRSLDGLIAAELKGIIELSELTQDDFVSRYTKTDSSDGLAELEARLNHFRRRGLMNIAMRYLLHERGAQVEAAKLPITQEQVSDRLVALRGEEARCRNKIRDEINEQIADVEWVIKDTRQPPALKMQFAQTLNWLQQGLDVLERGGKLDELPFFIETVVMEEQQPTATKLLATASAADTHNSSTLTRTDILQSKPRKLGFWRHLWAWANSSWSVKWKDIDKRG